MPSSTRLLAAVEFAASKHQKQRRKGGEDVPYINHTIQVANLLAKEGKVTDTALLMAAILHDTIEGSNDTFTISLQGVHQSSMDSDTRSFRIEQGSAHIFDVTSGLRRVVD